MLLFLPSNDSGKKNKGGAGAVVDECREASPVGGETLPIDEGRESGPVDEGREACPVDGNGEFSPGPVGDTPEPHETLPVDEGRKAGPVDEGRESGPVDEGLFVVIGLMTPSLTNRSCNII